MAREQWRVVSAVEIGTSHSASGAPCQDYADHSILTTLNGPVLVSVVCDGAGSAAHSEIGAWLTATTLIEHVELHFEKGRKVTDLDQRLFETWIDDVAERLVLRALEEGNDPRDYSCTMLAAVIGADGAAFAQLGDGAMVVSHGAEDGWSWVFWPFHGEYANQTVFVLSANAKEALQFCFAPRRINELAMFSDGIERLVLHGASKSVNDNFFEQMLAPVRASKSDGFDAPLSEKLKAYLGSTTVNARTNDDKSLVLATRYSPDEHP